jgi:hypothetical protein
MSWCRASLQDLKPDITSYWKFVVLLAEAEAKVTLRLTVGQSVSQYVLVSSPLWDLRPDINSV